MRYPAFFDTVPKIRVRDRLAEFLGAVDGGLIEYGYIDAVKLAGHSCPTVASAYWMTHCGLSALYPGELPERGAIRIEFRDDSLSGVTGVIANVVSMLTGATHSTGFKGLGGRFDRRHLMFFNLQVPLAIRFTRTDNAEQVDVAADLRTVTGDPAVAALMPQCLAGKASASDQQRFAEAWQDRVRRILTEHRDDPAVFVVRPAGRAGSN